MTPTRTPRLGFRVLGSATSRRRLIDFDAAFAAYAECADHAEVGREAYLSAFTYGEDFRRHLDETGSTRDYDGPCWAPWVWLDLDGEDLAATLIAARRLAARILDRYRTLDEEALLLFFSGSKGFHAGMPVTWGPSPSVTFHRTARRFAEALAAAAGVNIDAAVYDKVRLFRAPNSRHPKTGLHKRRLSYHELLHLNADRIRELAATPEPFALPVVAAADPQAAADWQAAMQAVERETAAKAERRAAVADGTPRLNKATLDFIRDGADPGDRHRSLFSAAANLGEFACPPALAHALLTDAALDSGLPPAEVRRQIECGLQHARPIPLTDPLPPTVSPASSSPPVATDVPRPPAHLQAQLAALWAAAATAEDEDAVELAREREAIQAEGCQLWPKGELPEDFFPFGANESGPYGTEGGRQ